jgi:hypothetical protein
MKSFRADASSDNHLIARRVVRSISAAMAALLLCAGTASAGSISTPVLFLGGTNQLVCIANNVSDADVTVKVRIIGTVSTTTETCTIPPNDAGGCQNFLNDQSGYCVIFNNKLTDAELKQRVRGVMFTRSTTPPFSIEAEVQAQ